MHKRKNGFMYTSKIKFNNLPVGIKFPLITDSDDYNFDEIIKMNENIIQKCFPEKISNAEICDEIFTRVPICTIYGCNYYDCKNAHVSEICTYLDCDGCMKLGHKENPHQSIVYSYIYNWILKLQKN